MSTYVMSDIHGYYDEMQKMLEQIRFSGEDTLIITGDYIDRGPQSYEMLCWVEDHPGNVILLCGNHDDDFLTYVDRMRAIFELHELTPDSPEDTRYAYALVDKTIPIRPKSVVCFDHYGTIGGLIREHGVTMAQLEVWSRCIREMPLVYRQEVGGRTCMMVHAGYIDSLEGVPTEKKYVSLEDFYLWARDDAYIHGGIRHGMVVAGHSPTIFDDLIPYNDGNVYRGYDESRDCIYYNIDCGIAYRDNHPNAKLACLRLEDEKVFYV